MIGREKLYNFHNKKNKQNYRIKNFILAIFYLCHWVPRFVFLTIMKCQFFGNEIQQKKHAHQQKQQHSHTHTHAPADAHTHCLLWFRHEVMSRDSFATQFAAAFCMVKSQCRSQYTKSFQCITLIVSLNLIKVYKIFWNEYVPKSLQQNSPRERRRRYSLLDFCGIVVYEMDVTVYV